MTTDQEIGRRVHMLPLSYRLRGHLRWHHTPGVGRWRRTCARCEHVDLGALKGWQPRTWETVDNTLHLPEGYDPPSASLSPPPEPSGEWGYLFYREACGRSDASSADGAEDAR